MEAEEDTELYASILEIEEKQLEKDERKVHPPAPVILQMEDDDGKDEEPVPKKLLGLRLPFRKKYDKTTVQPTKERTGQTDSEINKTALEEIVNTVPDGGYMEKTAEIIPEEKSSLTDEENVSSYIASVMQSVAEIEAGAEEELQKDLSEKRPYQSRLMDVEEDLSPKERLEKLMKLIEEDRQKEEPPKAESRQEELDLDEFLMDLVGANTITQAMVKSYHDENDSEDS